MEVHVCRRDRRRASHCGPCCTRPRVPFSLFSTRSHPARRLVCHIVVRVLPRRPACRTRVRAGAADDASAGQRTHAHEGTRAHSDVRTQAHMHAESHACTLPHTLPQTLPHTHSHTHTPTRSHAARHSHAHRSAKNGTRRCTSCSRCGKRRANCAGALPPPSRSGRNGERRVLPCTLEYLEYPELRASARTQGLERQRRRHALDGAQLRRVRQCKCVGRQGAAGNARDPTRGDAGAGPPLPGIIPRGADFQYRINSAPYDARYSCVPHIVRKHTAPDVPTPNR
jgi:hypothetical protein